MAKIITQKITLLKGAMPEEWTGTDWWTPEQHAAHDKRVEELKASGEYLKPEEYTVSYPEGTFDMFKPSPSDKPMFSNFGILIPKTGYND